MVSHTERMREKQGRTHMIDPQRRNITLHCRSLGTLKFKRKRVAKLPLNVQRVERKKQQLKVQHIAHPLHKAL